MVATILLHNTHFVPKSYGLVLAEVLTYLFMDSEYLTLVVREFKPLHNFLVKNKATFNHKNTDNRYFGYAIPSALEKLEKNNDRRIDYIQQKYINRISGTLCTVRVHYAYVVIHCSLQYRAQLVD